MTSVWNFSAGPAVLPKPVLQQAAAEMLDWRGTGISVMEMSHRSSAYTEIFDSAKQRLRQLLKVPDTHEVLLMQGGAIAQNAIVPMNLCAQFKQAAFVHTGAWSGKTLNEFSKYGQPHTVLSSASPSEGYSPMTYIPECSVLPERVNQKNFAYLHYCDNETIDGVEFQGQIEALAPQFDCPVVADVSSNILSKPIQIERFGVLYGGAQKNIGPAGLTVVIVNKSLYDRALSICPNAFHYATQAQANSMYNTPPTYAIYIAGLVFEWLHNQGGIEWAQQQAQIKSKLLYDFIDNSSFYASPVRRENRSRINIPFVLADEELNQSFLEKAQQAGLVQLKGHKSVGGMRASLYNAMPVEGVQALVEFMRAFEKENA